MLEDIWVALSELESVTFSFKQLDENYVASECPSSPHCCHKSGFCNHPGLACDSPSSQASCPHPHASLRAGLGAGARGPYPATVSSRSEEPCPSLRPRPAGSSF